ncbi:hypothetical protein Taro_007216 [Colocasia esculenta]|uniref:Small ribosomal subunit protein uS15 N-terminal domain-containing protein n=1 Tax=Colocasia esculenta TaxID=4460 RepID=A0A843TYE6_COLES|nr:hypothetical protein [Colocasia esculenta]
MGHMHNRGIIGYISSLQEDHPSWLNTSAQDVEENICKFVKKGLTPLQIGVNLCDSHNFA